MKIFRNIALVILSIVILYLGIALFTDKTYNVERSILIEKPVFEVFNYVKYLKNQDSYSVWADMDPEMNIEYAGLDGTIGFKYSWESKNDHVGKGEQEIKNIVEGRRIDYELRFKEPFENTDDMYMITEIQNDSTTLVKWGVMGKMNFPFNGMMLFFNFEKMLGPDLQKGLENLKEILEEKPSN